MRTGNFLISERRFFDDFKLLARPAFCDKPLRAVRKLLSTFSLADVLLLLNLFTYLDLLALVIPLF